MGLGGYLTWTAVVREIKQRTEDSLRIIPVEGEAGIAKRLVKSPVFDNNPHVCYDINYKKLLPLRLNNPATNYCIEDLPDRAVQRYDKHIIEQICEFYGIDNPELKCELFLRDEEYSKVDELLQGVNKDFIVIEPHSKTNYTPNRVYPFDKWQKVVDELSKDIEVLQVGVRGNKVLKNVTDFTGKTSFREAAALIGKAKLLLCAEGGLQHTATAVDTTALVIITGYQHERMIAYPQNINVNIASHGPCGLKVPCKECEADASKHNYEEIIQLVKEEIK